MRSRILTPRERKVLTMFLHGKIEKDDRDFWYLTKHRLLKFDDSQIRRDLAIIAQAQKKLSKEASEACERGARAGLSEIRIPGRRFS